MRACGGSLTPRGYFYVLPCLGFVFWGATTIPQVRDTFGLAGPGDEKKASYLLVAAAFLLPALDLFFDRLELRGKSRLKGGFSERRYG